MQNNNIESGSPCGTPHLTVGIRSACLAFKNRFRYLMNCGFTPCYFSSAIMTSCGTELKAFWISSYSKLCPLALISSTLARHRICAFFLKANWFGFNSVYFLNCSVSILWNTNNMVSWIAIGLKSFFFLGRNIDLNLNSFGAISIRS